MIIWLASYPRSGNTFLRTILNHAFAVKSYSIHNDDIKSIGANKKFSSVVGHESLPIGASLGKLRDADDIYAIKTHHPYGTFSKYFRGTDKIIYVVRDGRESTLSYFYYLRTFHKFHHDLSDIILGGAMYGSWASNVQSWLDASPPYLFLKYEDLVRDPYGSIREIQPYIGIAKKGSNIPTFEELRSVNSKFFRSGRTDSWREAYSNKELELFWARSAKTMLACGYAKSVPGESERDCYLKSQAGIPDSDSDSFRNSLSSANCVSTSLDPFARSGSYQYLKMEFSRIVNTNPFLRTILKRMPTKWLT